MLSFNPRNSIILYFNQYFILYYLSIMGNGILKCLCLFKKMVSYIFKFGYFDRLPS